MLTLATDEASSVAVWLFTGPHNSDEDYDRYVASLVDLRRVAAARGGGVGLLFVERANPVPNARWRRRIAEASESYPPNCLFAVVAESVVVRGTVTAINWLRPPTYDLTVVGTIPEALAWVGARREAPVLRALERCLGEAEGTPRRIA